MDDLKIEGGGRTLTLGRPNNGEVLLRIETNSKNIGMTLDPELRTRIIGWLAANSPSDEEELPNFQAFTDFIDGIAKSTNMLPESATAIKGWAAKMEKWAKIRLAEMSEYRTQVDALEEDATHLADNEEEYNDLRRQIIDFERGLLDVDDLRQLGRDLRDQIRTEERTAFP